MKFPLLVNAFGRQKLILEIGGNSTGLSEPRYQPQQSRRRRCGSDLANPCPTARGNPVKP